MFREVEKYLVTLVDGKVIVILSSKYRGSPAIMYRYDLLLGPKKIIERYRKELIPEFYTKSGWEPKIRYI